LKLNNLSLVVIAAIVIYIILVGVVYYEKTSSLETPEMVQALVAKAIKLYDEKGTDAFLVINDNAEFHGKQLYVYMFRDSDGIIVAHGVNKSLIGTNIDDLTDINDKNIGKTIIHDSATKDGVWVEYYWKDPETQKVLLKYAWLVKHDGYVFGSGIYTTDETLENPN